MSYIQSYEPCSIASTAQSNPYIPTSGWCELPSGGRVSITFCNPHVQDNKKRDIFSSSIESIKNAFESNISTFFCKPSQKKESTTDTYPSLITSIQKRIESKISIISNYFDGIGDVKRDILSPLINLVKNIFASRRDYYNSFTGAKIRECTKEELGKVIADSIVQKEKLIQLFDESHIQESQKEVEKIYDTLTQNGAFLSKSALSLQKGSCKEISENRVDFLLRKEKNGKIDLQYRGGKIGSGAFKTASFSCSILTNSSHALLHLQRKQDKKERVQAKKEFQKEYLISKAIQKKSIPFMINLTRVKVHKTGKECYLSEMCTKGNFRNLLQDATIPFSEKCNILSQAAQGLSELHTKLGYCHLDIKPENILITKNSNNKMEARICDFGCAAPIGAQKKYIYGTQNYMDPLIENEDILHYSTSMDIYSFGKIINDLVNYKELEIKREFIENLKKLHQKCIQSTLSKRPTMHEISEELLMISKAIEQR